MSFDVCSIDALSDGFGFKKGGGEEKRTKKKKDVMAAFEYLTQIYFRKNHGVASCECSVCVFVVFDLLGLTFSATYLLKNR